MFNFVLYNLECSIYTMNVVCQNQICLSVRNGMKNFKLFIGQTRIVRSNHMMAMERQTTYSSKYVSLKN